ncbi:MAG: protein kinase [Chloroflexota bacterium]|nr:protein kinase [Chloroflexota bacterium]
MTGQITLPEGQQRYGAAWSATDMQASSLRVIVREVLIPQDVRETSRSQEQVLNALIQRLRQLGLHPGLPHVLDYFTEQGIAYLVFQNIEGESLSSLLTQQRGALPERMAAEYAWHVCDILSFFASQQPPFIHGSINPDTIVIAYEGKQVSLIHLPLFPPKDPITTTVDTKQAGYYAPEQARGAISPSSDLYSLAATLYHAITGYSPLDHMAFFYPPARRLNPAVTPGMEMILARQLRLSVPQRFTHASEMQKELSALLTSYPDVEELEQPVLFSDPLRLNASQRRMVSQSTSLLNIGVFAAVIVLLLIAVLFAVLR